MLDLFERPRHPYSGTPAARSRRRPCSTCSTGRASVHAGADGVDAGAQHPRPRLTEIPGMVPALHRARPRLRVRAALRLRDGTLPRCETPALARRRRRPRRRLLRGRGSAACRRRATERRASRSRASAAAARGREPARSTTSRRKPLARASAAADPGGRRRLASTVARGETLALVGESGCGKTTTGQVGAAADRADLGLGAARAARS